MMSWFDKVRTYVGWDTDDQARIAELRRCLDSDLTEVIKDLGRELARFKGTQPLMGNARFVEHLHSVLRGWLTGLLDGTFDEGYVEKRLMFGQDLVAIDLTFEDVIVLEELARRELFEFAQRKLSDCPQELSSAMRSLEKAFNLDLALIYSAYLEVRDAEMERALLDRFLQVTGFSRTLYQNLAEARAGGVEGR